MPEIILWHPQTSTCVTAPWDTGGVWHVIKRSLAAAPARWCINCCIYPPQDSDFSASRRCPREPELNVFSTRTLYTAKEVNVPIRVLWQFRLDNAKGISLQKNPALTVEH